MSGLRYIDGVVTLAYDETLCTGCRLCTAVCPRGVFEMRDNRAVVVDRDACIECGACALNCSSGALSVDAGVGCAAGVISGWLRGTEPSCDCSGGSGC